MSLKYDKHKDEVYLERIRKKRCKACGVYGPNDPHHIKNSGGKQGNDYLAQPLCRVCHTGEGYAVHNSKDGEENWWYKRGYVMWEEVARELIEYIKEIKNNEKV